MNTQADWESAQTRRIGVAIKAARGKRSAQWLADQATTYGAKMTRQSVTDLENGRRRYVTIAELTAIAAALNTSPLMLLFGGELADGKVDALPGLTTSAIKAAQWFSGFDPIDEMPGESEYRLSNQPLQLARDLNQARHDLIIASNLFRGDKLKAEEVRQAVREAGFADMSARVSGLKIDTDDDA